MKNIHTHLPGFTKYTLLCLVILLTPIQSYARSINFTWTPNTNDTTIGYYLYYKIGSIAGFPYDGTDLDQGPSPIQIPGQTVSTYEITGASANVTYQFALKAYNAADEQSGYSDNVPIPPVSFPSPTINTMSQN